MVLHIFAYNFLNIQPIFNLKKVLKSWDLELSNHTRGISVHGGLCPEGVTALGVCVQGVPVQKGLCLGVSVHGGLCLGGLCTGGLCLGGLCPGGLCLGALSRGISARETPIQ